MFPLPYTGSAYSFDITQVFISSSNLALAHIPTVVISLAFAIWLYKHTKKLSAFYLLLVTIMFSLWAYFDLMTWTANSRSLMFAWSSYDIFSTAFIVFTYWFFYSFVKEKDLPFWQKLVSLCFLIPPLIYTFLSINMTEFFNVIDNAGENSTTRFYVPLLCVTFLLPIILITFIEYRKATEKPTKQKILLSGLASCLFLFIFSISFFITNMALYFNIGLPNAAYAISAFALFAMPFLTGILAYIVVKYEAFNIKTIKSILYILICMAILFVNIFLPW
jgi:hypothetical protein